MIRSKIFMLQVGDIVVENSGKGYFIREGIRDIDSQFAQFRTTDRLIEGGFVEYKGITNNWDSYEVIKECEVEIHTDILEIVTISMF